MPRPEKARRRRGRNLWLGCCLCAALPVGCQNAKPAPVERTAPWPVNSASPQAAAEAPLRFTLEALGHVRFTAKGKAAAPAGEFRVVRGELSVPLRDLSGVRGDVAVDLISVAMEGDKATQDDWTSRARAWLGVGNSLPEGTLEQRRWATFSISSIEDLSHAAANQGVKKTSDDAGSDATSGELRRVSFTAKGELTLNARRTRVALEMEADFFYPNAADGDAAPASVVLRTRQPFVISLATHDIQPRTSSGVLVAKDMKLLGVEVGTSARVSLELTARVQANDDVSTNAAALP